MPHVNLIAVLLCGVVSLALGGIWYSPLLFAKAWQRGVGISDDQAKSGNIAVIFGLTFLLSLIAAYVFGMFLGASMPLAGAVGAASPPGCAGSPHRSVSIICSSADRSACG